MAKRSSSRRTTYAQLCKHDFVELVSNDVLPIKEKLYVFGTIHKARPGVRRQQTWPEYYCISVGAGVAHVLGSCEQLDQAVRYLRTLFSGNSSKVRGMTKPQLIRFGIENYIIRTRSMYDRALRLTDVAFNLFSPSKSIGHESIVGNERVRNSSVVAPLKQLKKVVSNYSEARNTIVHERSWPAPVLCTSRYESRFLRGVLRRGMVPQR